MSSLKACEFAAPAKKGRVESIWGRSIIPSLVSEAKDALLVSVGGIKEFGDRELAVVGDNVSGDLLEKDSLSPAFFIDDRGGGLS